MTLSLTGPTGFIGQNLIKYFTDQGIKVHPLSLRGDWAYPENKDAIIHLAGKAHDTANTSAEEEYFKVNTELTEKLFDAFLASETRDFFYFSSVKAVADTVDDVLTEDQVAKPATPYGKSKLAAEKYLLSKSLPAGKRLFIIRPCMVHGPGNKGNLNLLYQFAKKGLPWPLAAFENERSFLSIDNLAFFLHQMLQAPDLPSGVYQLADDETLSTNQIIEIIANISGKNTHLWRLKPGLVSALAQVGDVLKLPINSERLQKLTERYVVSNHKIKQALNITRLPLTAREGLAKTIKSFSE